MANTNEARTVSASAQSNGLIDVKSLVLLAILLAAGFILNMTAGNALATVGIKPQFIIAAYALAILLTKANAVQSVIYALISACVVQVTTSIPGLNFVTEVAGALTMFALCKANLNVAGKSVTPFVGALIATFVSGALFAVLGTVIMGNAVATCLVKAPIVIGTSVFNAIVVQALYLPLSKVLNK